MIDEKTILVVSSNAHFLSTIQRNLVPYNYVVKGTRAHDEELMRTLTDMSPALTILDMPFLSMDGIRQLVGIRTTMDIPILMLSTQGAKADTVQTLSFSTGPRPQIKPLTFEQLTSQIKDLTSN
jgi:DNA-binding response OmpR family regulator